MNYLTELLAFYRWMAEHPLTPLLQAYWHLLMYYNNKAAILAEDGRWYWPVTFRAANSVVGQALGLKDRFKITSADTWLSAAASTIPRTLGRRQEITA